MGNAEQAIIKDDSLSYFAAQANDMEDQCQTMNANKYGSINMYRSIYTYQVGFRAPLNS
ncbi:hypothetical protein [Vibrio sp. 99-70-13A1]|uniref:hypothetical protein n=1 Tax=Vibrio sp. 99-70-13A1 TaxID=2607601 RepID=UPI001493CE3C|nr:hypothetical protein [Vibrio sp. 99-70-13A1]